MHATNRRKESMKVLKLKIEISIMHATGKKFESLLQSGVGKPF